MKIELIPVIEITNYDQEIPMPSSGPYWEFYTQWEEYHLSTNIKAGFSENFKPYSKGSSFYRITNISDSDLLKIILKEIEIQHTEENIGINNLKCPFYGGYILRIDNVNKYFPQCCGSLSDIENWEGLLSDDYSYFYMGHPSPRIEKLENKIIFDFLNSEIQERYSPPILEDCIEVNESLLAVAIENARNELNEFSESLIRINKMHNLNIPEIDKKLIHGIDD